MLQPQAVVRNALTTGRESVTVFLTDVGHGLLDVSHSMLAMVGLAVVAGGPFIGRQGDLRGTPPEPAGGRRRRRPPPPRPAPPPPPPPSGSTARRPTRRT